ncbi:hypothetical protein SNE40_009804 [Patella caerulea]|uniref:Uncharacterized protein n=2 Tax=Patella caerulea TaxID=87958 RepID=A0AAN8PQR9_PATCE
MWWYLAISESIIKIFLKQTLVSIAFNIRQCAEKMIYVLIMFQPMPGEIARYVYSDAEFRTVHIRLRRSYEYCENLLRDWGQEYVKRLRNAISANPTKAPNNPIKRN